MINRCKWLHVVHNSENLLKQKKKNTLIYRKLISGIHDVRTSYIRMRTDIAPSTDLPEVLLRAVSSAKVKGGSAGPLLFG